jgi:integrase
MPRLRDGVIRRGGSWSYVIRVPDPATGLTKPKWVGGFETEQDAKAARDQARVRARHGAYVNRSTSTVADYLAEWLETHAATVKPKTLAGYRHDIDHYIVPRIGRMRLQALRPAVISKLYRDLTEHGGRDGRPLSAWTVSHIHRTLRKALADAVDVEQLLAANPAERSKRPQSRGVEPVPGLDRRAAGLFPCRCAVSPTVRLLPSRCLYRRASRRTALPPVAVRGPGGR